MATDISNAVTHGQLGRGFQPPALQVQEQFAPALGAFAKATGQAQNILVAPFVSADNHQHTLAIVFAKIDPPDRFLYAQTPSGA